LTAGEYIVHVKDSNTPEACTASDKIHLTAANSTIAITDFTVIARPTCESATGAIAFKITGNGSIPYYYQLDDMDKVEITTNDVMITINNLPAGKHTLYVNDKCGNAKHEFELINTDNPLKFSVTTENIVVDCIGNLVKPGLIIMTVTGSSGPYSYRFESDAAWTQFKSYNTTKDTIFVTHRGSYKVEVQNASGCVYSYYNVEIDNKSDCYVELDVRLFLQGVTQAGPVMSTYLQGPPAFSVLMDKLLPKVNPYSIPGRIYSQINNPTGSAGKVVDWVLVEIWGNFETIVPYTLYDLVEVQALLLKPDGRVVDTNGMRPKFKTYSTSDVRIIVKHRNHLAVISNDVLSINSSGEIIPYNFSTSQSQAYKLPWSMQEPMEIRHGVACLWAGDLNMNSIIDAGDNMLYYIGYDIPRRNIYTYEDVNMDAMVDSRDAAFILENAKRALQSPLIYFFKKN